MNRVWWKRNAFLFVWLLVGIVLLVVIEAFIFSSDSNLSQRFTAGSSVLLAVVALTTTFIGNSVSRNAVEQARLQFRQAQPLVSLESESAIKIVTDADGVSACISLKNFGEGIALFREPNFRDYKFVRVPFLSFPLITGRRDSVEEQLVLRQDGTRLLLPFSRGDVQEIKLSYKWGDNVPDDLCEAVKYGGLDNFSDDYVFRIWYSDVTRDIYHVLTVYFTNPLHKQVDIAAWRSLPPATEVAILKINDVSVLEIERSKLSRTGEVREPDHDHGDIRLRDPLQRR